MAADTLAPASWPDLLATYLLHSSALLLATWAASVLWRWRRPALGEWPWKLAALAGFASALFAWGSRPPFGAEDGSPAGRNGGGRENPRLLDPDPTGSRRRASEAEGAAGGLDRSEASRARRAPRPSAAPAAPFAAEGDAAAAGGSPAWSEREALAFRCPEMSLAPAAWAFGALGGFGLLRIALQSRAWRRRLRGLKPIEDGTARRLLDELLAGAASAGGRRRRVRLLSSASRLEPAALGVWRWRIVLPAGIEERLARDELKALLAHELAHLRRADGLWLIVGRLLCSLFAFQPLNLLAFREWRRASEYGCDEWALRRGVAPLSLARCLTRIAEWKLRSRPAAAPLAAVGVRSVAADRVIKLLARAKAEPAPSPRSAAKLVGFAALLLSASAAAWAPGVAVRFEDRAQGIEEEPSDARSEWDRIEAELEVLDLSLSEAEAELRLFDRLPPEAARLEALQELFADWKARAQSGRERLLRLVKEATSKLEMRETRTEPPRLGRSRLDAGNSY